MNDLAERLREIYAGNKSALVKECLDEIERLTLKNEALEDLTHELTAVFAVERKELEVEDAAYIERLAADRDRWEQDWRTQTLAINRLVAAAEDRNEVDATRAKLHQEDLDKLTDERDAALVDARRYREALLKIKFQAVADAKSGEWTTSICFLENTLSNAAIAKETP